MNTHNHHQAGNAAVSTPRTGRRWLIAAALAVAAATAGVSFASDGPGLPHHPGHGGHAGHMAMDPAAMDAHIDKMVAQFADGASPDQQARVAAIFKAAVGRRQPPHPGGAGRRRRGPHAGAAGRLCRAFEAVHALR
jgi:hypothetical protein